MAMSITSNGSSAGECRWVLKAAEVEAARTKFGLMEPRDLFYRAATELVSSALEGRSGLTKTECLLVLLQTWNKNYYRFKGIKDQKDQHFKDIDGLLKSYESWLGTLRVRGMDTFTEADENKITEAFNAFEQVLGPVGTAKCLHLLAPRFFPLWDRAIARAYRCALRPLGQNAAVYLRFMRSTRCQVQKLCEETTSLADPLKAIDEYNYCKYTQQWI